MNSFALIKENLIFSLNSTVPIFLLIILGWFLMQIKLFNKDFTAVADKYVFKVALPVLLFKDIATANIHENFQLKFVLFCMIATTIMFLGTWALASVFMKDKSMVGAFVQASARGSAAILGIAFVNNIYGSSGMAPMMIVAAVPLYNIYSVIILTFCSNDRQNSKGTIKKALINIVKNPIIIGIFLGLPFSLLNIELPVILSKTITNVANTATPIALLVVGATFEGRKAIKKIKPTMIATFIKLIGIPLVFFPFAVLLGFRGSELVAILVMLGSPTTVTCYIMAKNMGNDEVLSSSIVVMATLLSSITLTLWVFVLKSLALI
ncbi:MAG: AEC family transporter [Clostridiales bacterium]|nr:AEC family transporter [Clostridiales bacterium]MDY3747639.1 AEC family transporter [Lachnospiraceae bacterium]